MVRSMSKSSPICSIACHAIDDFVVLWTSKNFLLAWLQHGIFKHIRWRDAFGRIKFVETWIAVSVQEAFEVCEFFLRVIAFAVRGVTVEHGWRGIACVRAAVEQIDPEARRLGFARAGGQHFYRRVVSVDDGAAFT